MPVVLRLSCFALSYFASGSASCVFGFLLLAFFVWHLIFQFESVDVGFVSLQLAIGHRAERSAGNRGTVGTIG